MTSAVPSTYLYDVSFVHFRFALFPLQVTMMMGRETNLKEQLELYQSQVNEMESNLGGTTTTFNSFRKEMDRLTKQLKKVERDTDEWKNKFQESQVMYLLK